MILSINYAKTTVIGTTLGANSGTSLFDVTNFSKFGAAPLKAVHGLNLKVFGEVLLYSMRVRYLTFLNLPTSLTLHVVFDIITPVIDTNKSI